MNELRKARLDAGLTQRELATRLKCGQSHISELESGTDKPSHALTLRIMCMFGVEVFLTQVKRKDGMVWKVR